MTDPESPVESEPADELDPPIRRTDGERDRDEPLLDRERIVAVASGLSQRLFSDVVLPLVGSPQVWMALGAAAFLGFSAGIVVAYVPEPAIVEALRKYEPAVVTRIYDDEGLQFDQWSLERREVIGYDEIAPIMVQAVVSAEDSRFFHHVGIDPWAVFRAAIADVICGYFCEGFSTITMQIPRNLDLRLGGDTWLPQDKTLERKIREAVYAIQIERHYSKEQIFAIYANQIFMGHDAHGFQAASKYYFGKPISDVNLPEAALLAGMIQVPNRYNPYRFPDRAVQKRNVILDRMVAEGYIDETAAAEAKAAPLMLDEDERVEALAPYFTEEIRKGLIRLYGVNGIYRSGLHVYTTLDRDLQTVAERALDRGLRAHSKRRGWLGPLLNVFDEAEATAAATEAEAEATEPVEPADETTWTHRRWDDAIRPDDVVPAVVMQVSAESARVRIGDAFAELTLEDAEWTRRSSIDQLLRVGDVVSVRVLDPPETDAPDGSTEPGASAAGGTNDSTDADDLESGDSGDSAEAGSAEGDEVETRTLFVTLDQEPTAQGAVLVVENHTGEVKALVGGAGFDDSEFNRAIQAVRQTGSIFKPFVYTTAIARGLTPSELFLDQPHTFRDPTTRQPYSPANFGDRYIGITSIAEALSESRNVPTVKLQEQIGVTNVMDTARRFGLTSQLGPYLSLGLGVIDVSPWEIVRAYTVFPNQGVLAEPHLFRQVRGRDGRLLEQTDRRAVQVTGSDVAYIMTRMLIAGVERGTGEAAKPLARRLQMPLGGKSGTTDDYSDAWYVGFSPYHTVGIWVGHDTKTTLGRLETGSRAALPIWIEVMEAAATGMPAGDFSVPGNIELRTVDPFTGLLHNPDVCGEQLVLGYLRGTGPTRVCSRTEHDILALPGYQQAYFLSNGRFDTGR